MIVFQQINSSLMVTVMSKDKTIQPFY